MLNWRVGALAGPGHGIRSHSFPNCTSQIAGLERQIAKAKADFGKEVYEAMVASDKQATERLFTATRTRVRELEADIAAKHAFIHDMKHHDDSAASPLPPRGDQSSGTWGAPPPTPPPGAPALPSGWKRATSPDGREYYYHEISGETSWTVPMA